MKKSLNAKRRLRVLQTGTVSVPRAPVARTTVLLTRGGAMPDKRKEAARNACRAHG
jgi:hypothetical protein